MRLISEEEAQRPPDAASGNEETGPFSRHSAAASHYPRRRVMLPGGSMRHCMTDRLGRICTGAACAI
jgi:hypothetical protein